MPAKSCTGCKNIGSKECGQVVKDKGNGNVRYVKVPDERCNQK